MVMSVHITCIQWVGFGFRLIDLFSLCIACSAVGSWDAFCSCCGWWQNNDGY